MARMRVDQYHQVIRKPRVLNVGVLSPARGDNRLFQHPIYLSEVEVAKHWRNPPPLWNALCPGRLQDHLEEPHHRSVLYPPGHLSKQQRMLNIVVGRDETCDYVACARPPSPNPPRRSPATAAPGGAR